MLNASIISTVSPKQLHRNLYYGSNGANLVYSFLTSDKSAVTNFSGDLFAFFKVSYSMLLCLLLTHSRFHSTSLQAKASAPRNILPQRKVELRPPQDLLRSHRQYPHLSLLVVLSD